MALNVEIFKNGKLENFYQFLPDGRTLSKKNINIFPQPDMTIHTPIESPCRVDKTYAVF
jgi:hypothetical protein